MGQKNLFIYFCWFLHFWPTKNANFGHWTSPNDFWGHLGQEQFFKVFWLTKNANFGHWTPPHDFWEHLEPKKVFSKFGIFEPPNMQILQILVIEDPQMTFGGIWSKTFFF